MQFEEIEILKNIEDRISEELEKELRLDRAYTQYFSTLEKRWLIIHEACQQLMGLRR